MSYNHFFINNLFLGRICNKVIEIQNSNDCLLILKVRDEIIFKCSIFDSP